MDILNDFAFLSNISQMKIKKKKYYLRIYMTFRKSKEFTLYCDFKIVHLIAILCSQAKFNFIFSNKFLYCNVLLLLFVGLFYLI